MKIGIDASRAFFSKRTGIEEYSYQVIKNLACNKQDSKKKLENHQVFLYLRKNQRVSFALPKNWKVRIIKWSYFWTQIGLSLEMIFHPVDVLFVPAHIVPWIIPQKTVVTIHGLEYEFCKNAYSFWERVYMRFFIKRSSKKASKIIAVSENTKKDLVNFYKIPKDKIEVVYEGCELSQKSKVLSVRQTGKSQKDNLKLRKILSKKYLLFIGRIEERKNILGIIEAFEVLKEKYRISHKLVLAGKPGYGYNRIKSKVQSLKPEVGSDVLELGFVSKEEKLALLSQADIFLFPSFYEGFGLPILEAQSVGKYICMNICNKMGTAVITSNTSSLPEVAGEGALLVDPEKPSEIAEAVWKLISDETLRDELIKKGYENLKRFSWQKCAEEIAEILKK